MPARRTAAMAAATGMLAIAASLTACGSPAVSTLASVPAQHDSEWRAGFNAGMQAWQQIDFGTVTAADKNPQDAQLVDYCVQYANGVNKPSYADYTQWEDGFSYGCYGGT